MLLQHLHDIIALKSTCLNNSNNNNILIVLVVIIWSKLHLGCRMSLFLHRHTHALEWGVCNVNGIVIY